MLSPKLSRFPFVGSNFYSEEGEETGDFIKAVKTWRSFLWLLCRVARCEGCDSARNGLSLGQDSDRQKFAEKGGVMGEGVPPKTTSKILPHILTELRGPLMREFFWTKIFFPIFFCGCYEHGQRGYILQSVLTIWAPQTRTVEGRYGRRRRPKKMGEIPVIPVF